jgi:hypothetical protein
MKKIALLTILMTFLSANAMFADDTVYENAGTSGAQYLKIGIGARPAALGDSYAALSDDAFGIFWNPAGVNKIKAMDAGLLYNSWLSDISQEVFAITVPFSLLQKPIIPPAVVGEDGAVENPKPIKPTPNSTISFGAVFVNMPPIQGSDIYGNETDKYNAYNMVLVFSFSSRLFSDNLSWGVSTKYIKETIEKENATGSCYDLGLSYRSTDKSTMLGLALQNFGSDMKFVSEAFPLPRNIKAGAAYWLLDEKLLTVCDVNKAIDENLKYSFGAELCPYKEIAIRAGWQSSNSATFGFGVKYQSAYFDYAFAPYENIGGTHRASIHIRFNSQITIEKPKPKKEEAALSPHNTGCIFGKITDKDGKPLKNIIVKISKDDRERLRLKTDEQGSFKTQVLPFGMYEVKAWGELFEADFKEVPIEMESGIEADFKLFPPKNENYIFGMITDHLGKALQNVVVKVSQNNEEKFRINTDRDGTYRTPPLPYGVYEIKVWEQEEDKAQIERCKVKRGKPLQLDYTF